MKKAPGATDLKCLFADAATAVTFLATVLMQHMSFSSLSDLSMDLKVLRSFDHTRQ